MTLVNHETGEIVETIGADEARRLTTEAQNEFRSSREHFDRAWSLIEQAVEGGGHVELGYRSPGDYLHAEFDGVLSGLDVPQRRIAVKTMTDWGLSTRAIAQPLGVSNKTVSLDQRAPVTEVTPDPTDDELVEVYGDVSEEQFETALDAARADDDMSHANVVSHIKGGTPAPSNVIGIDGKTYQRPTSKPERSGEQQNAEENSRTLASTLIFLLAFQHPNQRDTARIEWAVGSPAVSPTNRDYVTSDRMRQAARGLVLLADEWESTNE